MRQFKPVVSNFLRRYLKLVDLPFLVILEFIHILLQLPALFLRSYLLVLGRLRCDFQVGDCLFQFLDLSLNLDRGMNNQIESLKQSTLTLVALLPSTCSSSNLISCSFISNSLANFFHFSFPSRPRSSTLFNSSNRLLASATFLSAFNNS